MHLMLERAGPTDDKALHDIRLAANSIEGPYVAPTAAGLGVGTALVKLAQRRIAQAGDQLIVLDSSCNALGFYLRLGYAPAGRQRESGALPMRKYHAVA